jgi:hypothetical protein
MHKCDWFDSFHLCEMRGVYFAASKTIALIDSDAYTDA